MESAKLGGSNFSCWKVWKALVDVYEVKTLGGSALEEELMNLSFASFLKMKDLRDKLAICGKAISSKLQRGSMHIQSLVSSTWSTTEKWDEVLPVLNQIDQAGGSSCSGSALVSKGPGKGDGNKLKKRRNKRVL